jgi:catechol 2,3-dioxygenase-like lactoylglutathione lyase family enzyme
MFDHVAIQAADVEAAVAFYVRVFKAIGFTEVTRHPVGDSSVVGIAGRRGFPGFWIGPAGGEETREIHIAFSALSTDEVDAVHQAALDASVEILHAPRIFPEYHPGYYAVFVRDLDGHNVEAVHHIQAPAATE